MGRGNVCVTGQYEGLYFIDRDCFDVYRRNDEYSEEPEVRLAKDLSYQEITSPDWIWDEWGTGEELDDVLECFIDSFTRRFKSFQRENGNRWIDREIRVLMENKLFVIGLEDNEWSMAVKLIQKEDPYNELVGLQSKHYQGYLDGMKRALLERLPSIGTYTGAWTSGTIKREELQ